MENIKVLIDENTLYKRISEMADEISNEYKGEEVILVGVLKGAVYFTVELSKHIKDVSVIMDFIKVSSYGIGARETSGKIDFKLDISQNIENKNVIIVEDIIDSGTTLKFLREYLETKHPKTLKICTLLDKPERRIHQVEVDYTGFEIENKFVVGFGLDADEKYRNLNYIGYIE